MGVFLGQLVKSSQLFRIVVRKVSMILRMVVRIVGMVMKMVISLVRMVNAVGTMVTRREERGFLSVSMIFVTV